MSKKILIPFYLIIISNLTIAQDTTIFNQSVNLNSSLSNYKNVDVVSGGAINLLDGFLYTASSNGELTTQPDVYSVNEPTGFCPNGSPSG